MKLINQQKLLSSILSSDILYFTLRNNKTKNSNFFVNKIKLNQKNNYVLLNIDYFLQNIKQLIRLLQYHFKHHKNFIQIVSSNLMYNEILEQVFKKYGNADNNIKVRKLLNIITSLHKSTKRDYVGRMLGNKVECMKIAKKYGLYL